MNEIYDSVDFECLYLLKEGENEVFVNSCQTLQRQQIDGLRFLFKQFQKKNPGVIINFPPACGKSVTVVLFLNAVKKLLKYPILILCNDECEMGNWKKQFIKWTDYIEEDISVESSNPCIKEKKVFLKKLESLNSYLRRRWSVVIVKADVATKELLKTSFEADFKIWITSTDVKKDLSMLSSVYTWLHPNSKFNINNFKAQSPKEIFQKSILLDAFIEDIVIRENSDMEPFMTSQKIDSVIDVEVNQRKRSKISIKNKDATGTKIKRSKRILTDELLNTSNSNDNLLTRDNDNDFCIKHHDNRDDNNDRYNNDCNVINERDTEKLDVENFIRDQKPLQSYNHMDLDNLSRFHDKEELIVEFENSTLNHDNLKDKKKEEQSTESLIDDFEVEFQEIKDNNENDKESNINGKNGVEKQSNTKIHPNADMKDEVADVKSDMNNEVADVKSDMNNEVADVRSDMNNEIADVKSDMNNEDADVRSDMNNELADVRSAMNNEIADVKSDMNNEVSDVKSVVNNELNEVKNKDIDFKMSEIEENVFKKFKGSILDSIF